jgi:hypothetical protein
MSTLSPNYHQDSLMSSSPVNMATKTKPAPKAATAANVSQKQKTQMHRRSRTGLSALSSGTSSAHTCFRFRFVCHTVAGLAS